MPPEPLKSAAQPSRSRRIAWRWLLLLAIPCVEIFGHYVVLARVPCRKDFQRAADFIAARQHTADWVTSAPSWIDPIFRSVIGDRLTMQQVGPADLAVFERVWALSIRGHDPVAFTDQAPDFQKQFGRVLVRRWDLGKSAVVYDLTANVARAEVTIAQEGSTRGCRFSSAGPPRGGGLGAGAVVPSERFVCDPARPWLWVGNTMLEDLDLQPRYCVWQHPAGLEPITVTYRDVPLGTHIVLHAGLYYEDERELTGGPVNVTVRIDGKQIGQMVHRDGDGWKDLQLVTRDRGRPSVERGTIEIEVTAPNTHRRSLCWAATVRSEQKAWR